MFHCAYCDFVTKRRDTSELLKHVVKAHSDKTFRCGQRGSFGDLHFPGPDYWQKENDGSLTCSYCGSMSEDDLIDILTHYVAGDEGYYFDTTTKNYKLYAHRPGVNNAGEGAIKFYKFHVNPDHPDFAQHEALYKQAVDKFHREMEERYPTKQARG